MAAITPTALVQVAWQTPPEVAHQVTRLRCGQFQLRIPIETTRTHVAASRRTNLRTHTRSSPQGALRTNGVSKGTKMQFTSFREYRWNQHMNRPLDEALSEVERECHVRLKCFDKWVNEGKLS